MTEQRKAELRGLCERVTEGPWYTERDTTGDLIVRYGEQGRCLAIPARGTDAEFISAARTALPELLDELDALTAELAAVTKRADAAGSLIIEIVNNGICTTCEKEDCDGCESTNGCDWPCLFHAKGFIGIDASEYVCGPVAAEGKSK